MRKGILANSEEGRLIAEDCLHLSELIFGVKNELEEKFWEIRKSAVDSSSAGLYPIKAELLTFLEGASFNETECNPQV